MYTGRILEAYIIMHMLMLKAAYIVKGLVKQFLAFLLVPRRRGTLPDPCCM